MPNPVAVNDLSPISGSLQTSRISYAVETAGKNYGQNYNSTTWYSDILQNGSQYTIISDNYTANYYVSRSNAEGAYVEGGLPAVDEYSAPVFWLTAGTSSLDIITIVNGLPDRRGQIPFNSGSQALNWIISSSNYFAVGPPYEQIDADNLGLYINSGQIISYPTTMSAWYDISGQNNRFTLTNGPTFSAANLGSIVFDGTNDYAVVNPVSAFDIYCISMWFKPTTIINSASAYKPLIHFKSSIGKYIFFGDGTTRVANEYITIVQEPGDKRTAVNDGGSLSAGTWYNIVFNYESSQYNIYINNTLKSTTIGTSTGNVPLITDPDFIYLNSYEGTSGYLDSSLSMCMIYNRVLTATEMLKNYNATKGRFGL